MGGPLVCSLRPSRVPGPRWSAEAAASPAEIAMARLRDYFASSGPLAAAQDEHHKALSARDEAIPYSEAIFEQPALQQALAQIRASGREKQVARVLDAVAVGAEKGQSVGLLHEAELFAGTKPFE